MAAPPTSDNGTITLEPQRLMGERFTQLKVLGSGAFGEALLVIDKTTRRHMVVKRLLQRTGPNKRPQQELDLCLSEIRNIQSITHINIVTFHSAWVEQADQQLHMLFEYCDGGDLEHYLAKSFPVPEPVVVQIMAQLLVALDHLHIKHFIHRDVKLANVLLCRSPLLVKIGDFGLSKELNNTDAAAHTCLGTPLYFSPEIAAMKDYTRKTDIWSLGVLCYQLLTNQAPFHGRTMSEVLDRIKHHHPVPPAALSPQYNPELSRLVLKMLTKSRTARPTARELLASPVFKAPLQQWPWQPQWAGCRCMFVCRDNCCVNIRSQPTTRSDILHVLSYGDQILVRREVVPTDGGVGSAVWYQVVFPVADGYCISCDLGKQLFQGIDDAARASPFPRQVATPTTSPTAGRGATPSPLRHRSPLHARDPGAGRSPREAAAAPVAPQLAGGVVRAAAKKVDSPIHVRQPSAMGCRPLFNGERRNVDLGGSPSPVRRPVSPLRPLKPSPDAPSPYAKPPVPVPKHSPQVLGGGGGLGERRPSTPLAQRAAPSRPSLVPQQPTKPSLSPLRMHSPLRHQFGGVSPLRRVGA